MEPATDAPAAPDAGSASFGPGRVVVVAALVAACVASPGLSPLLLPFAVALVAIRLAAARASSERFLLAVGVASAAAAATVAGAAPGPLDTGVAIAVAVAIALSTVVGLGIVQALGARPDSARSLVEGEEWPEPQALTGFTPVLAAWLAVTLAFAGVGGALAGRSEVVAFAREAVHEGYAPYARECAADGALADNERFCERMETNRDQYLRLADRHGVELLAVAAALFALSGAVTSHLATGWALRRRPGASARPSWKLRQMEVHWSTAYLLAAGLVLAMASDLLPGAVATWLLAAGAALGAVAGLLVVGQGVGLAAWTLHRGARPRWFQALLVVLAFLAWPAAAIVLFGLGLVDLALHPRRRFSGTVSRRDPTG